MADTAAHDTSAPPPLPYTYFRAGGAALDRLETVQASKKELEKLKQALCKRYGANEVMLSRDAASGRVTVSSFYYIAAFDKNVPAHWESQRQMSDDGKLQAIFAHPPAGSPDAFFIADYAGLMQRPMRRMRLENVLGSGDMPMRELPAGSYSGAFVRDRHMTAAGDSDAKIGHIRDNVTMCFGSNSPCRAGDPLDAMEMMGHWYIRVPNDENGKPRFTPPDSAIVPLAEMMKIDLEERGARSDRARMASFNPII